MELDPKQYKRKEQADNKYLRDGSTFRLSIQHPDTRNHRPQYFSGNRNNYWEFSSGPVSCELNQCFNSDLFDPHPANPKDVHSETSEAERYRWLCLNAASLDRISVNNESSSFYLTCGPFDYGNRTIQQDSREGPQYYSRSKPSMSGSFPNGSWKDNESNFCRRVLVGGLTTKVPGLPTAKNGGVYTLRRVDGGATIFNKKEHSVWQFVTPNFDSPKAPWEIVDDANRFKIRSVYDYAVVNNNMVLLRTIGEDGSWVYLRGNQQSSLDEDGFYTVFTSKLPDTLEKWDKFSWEFLWKLEILDLGWYGGVKEIRK